MTMYIDQLYQLTKDEISELIEKLDNNASWLDLIKIDYAFYHNDPNYDGGLSFLDRIAAKIGRFNPNWNIQEMKQQIRDSDTPTLEYIVTIAEMFEKPSMIAYYGV